MVVDTYATGSLFLDSLAQGIPNCLLLDFQMPGMSGLDVLRYLGQRHICIPSIVITGFDENGSREACMKAGALAYLLKPLEADLLVEKIVKICGKPPPNRSHPSFNRPRPGPRL
jgi:FixJ family two-component response regulator